MTVIEEHVMLPAGQIVSVKGNYKAAYRLPEKTPIPMETDGEYTKVRLPEITGYDIFLLEK